MNAAIAENEIAVQHSVRPDVGLEFLTFPISGWDEVSKICKKVLLYDGRRFVFSCWNSDRMECVFRRPLIEDPKTARVIRR